MNNNNKFSLILRTSHTYINISNSATNISNVVEIDKNPHNIDQSQYNSIQQVIENNFDPLVQISKEQTADYLDIYAVDGYVNNITILFDDTNIYVNFAVNDTKTKELGDQILDQINKIILKED